MYEDLTPESESFVDNGSWKEDIQAGLTEWLESFSDKLPIIEENELDSPDLYSFYSQLSALQAEHKKSAKRSHDFSSKVNDVLAEVEANLALLVKQFDQEIIDTYKIRLFKPLTGILVTFVRISSKIQELPKFSWFSSPKRLNNSLEAMEQGILLVKSHFNELLLKEKVSKIPTLNNAFDPYTMTAVSVEERDDLPPNTIICEISPGFLLNDKILVLAEVKVSKSKGNK